MAKKLRTLLLCVLISGILLGIPLPAQATKTTAVVRCPPQQEQYIWDYFLNLTGSLEGTAGIVGNLYFESHLLSENLESHGRIVSVKEGMDYTKAVDQGSYTDFVNDGMGYGLAQWTYPGRKQRLLEIARNSGASIGSLDVQLTLIAEELEKYNMLYRLSYPDSLRFASDYVMVNFENPADQSEEKMLERFQICMAFYEKYAQGKPGSTLTDLQYKIIAIAKHSDTFEIPVKEGYCLSWANEVYTAAGLPSDPSTSAAVSANKFSVSDDFSAIPAGAAIYGHSNSTNGHVGIYVGNEKVYHIAGGVAVDTLDNWIEKYDGYCWGWIGGSDLKNCAEDFEDTVLYPELY